MDPTNLNTSTNISKLGASNACINDELCCANILSAIGIGEDSNEIKSIPHLKDACLKKKDAPCSRVGTVDSASERCQVQCEINLSDIKLESVPNEVALGKESDADKVSTSNTSTSCMSNIKLEPANRKDADLDDNLGEFVRYVLNASKIPHKIFDNDYARRLRGVEQSDANVNIIESEDSFKVKIDSLSTNDDVPYTDEDVTKKCALQAENPTNIVCCPDIMGEVAQSHTNKRRKKIQQTERSGKIGQIDANEHGVMFIDADSKVRRPPTPYKCEGLNRCETSLPSSSLGCRTDPVEEFILPDIHPIKLQPRIDDGNLAQSGTRGIEFCPKYITKPKNFKRNGPPAGRETITIITILCSFHEKKSKKSVCHNKKFLRL